MAMKSISKIATKVFGSRNERLVKGYRQTVDRVNALEPEICRLSDTELRAKTDEFRERLAGGESIDALTPEIFAVAREAMDRAVGIRSILNPEHAFDASRLPAGAKAAYEKAKAEADAMEPLPPEGDLQGCREPVPAWQVIDLPVELYEAVRELYPESRPPFRSRPFDVQIIGAIVLSEGRIAEMKTGEGKTIVAPLAAYRAAVKGEQVHVVTVNDYLVQRDRDWTFPFFRSLGLTVGSIHPMHMQPPPLKKLAYDCNVVYGTTSEFGFDYLRDNMKLSVAEQVQGERHFAIVDEVDSVLIDEARTPLIISGPARSSRPRYETADQLARQLVDRQKDWNDADVKVQSCLAEIASLEGDIRNAADKGKVPELKRRLEEAKAKLPELEAARDRFVQFYEVELDKKKATLTHEGIEEAQRLAGVGSFYVGDNIDLPHLLEQSIRAHTVYQRDRDYVVAPGQGEGLEVVIVDQNTGRKMVGRQWSDGLHQAVEAKEGVDIKEETQTMATVTVQNFFKMYDRLAGMTGTADTEATEFHEIYGLDVVVIPTNVPVRRIDSDDVVYMGERDKWEAIVDEIRRFHDAGQPVLVGTTSVENSERLAQMLGGRNGVPHEVLNAKQHEREADIVTNAGQLGAVMIATNMAGRGTDIKLQKFTREELLKHWQKRGIAPREIDASMDDEEILARVHRHLVQKELGLSKADAEALSGEEARLAMLRHWAIESGWVAENKASSMGEDALMDVLDEAGTCRLHRLAVWEGVEAMGGLHVVATERHESRRIDNQLRGRSGRQGDNGSSRFFLSLEDPLMKMFAGETTLKLLSRMGMKEGASLQHPLLSRSVGKAQRKVEERNFLVRKNILEYDEVMDHQRHRFYADRQAVLEGREIKERIFDHIEDAVNDAAHRYLSKTYVGECIGEWVHENLSVTIDAERLKGKASDRDDLRAFVLKDAREEVSSEVRLVMNEYMPDESEPADWDLKSLADWANGHFKASVKVSELQDRSRREIFERLEQAGFGFLDEQEVDALDQFCVPHYAERELAGWIRSKFGAEVDPEELAKFETPDRAVDLVMEKARDAYRRRERIYPIEFALEATTATLQRQDLAPEQRLGALQQFCAWAKARYELDWEPDSLPSTQPAELGNLLLAEAEKWDESRIAERADRAVAFAGSDVDKLDEWFREHCGGARLTDDERTLAEDDPKTAAERKIASVLRAEMTQFERWILLQILDQAWKEHLYAIDQLRESIGLRSFSQRDPRIEFKREGARLFEEMQEQIRDKVTDLVFRARLTPQAQAPQRSAADSARALASGNAEAAAAAAAEARRPTSGPADRPGGQAGGRPAAASGDAVPATDAQRRDLEVAQQAGVPQGGGAAGGARAAAAARPRRKPAQSAPTIGRNEMVTIVNPATGEKQELKFKKAQPLIREGWRLSKS